MSLWEHPFVATRLSAVSSHRPLTLTRPWLRRHRRTDDLAAVDFARLRSELARFFLRLSAAGRRSG